MLRPKSSLMVMIKRYKNPPHHWASLARKKFPKDRALENFDDFYGSVYGNRWKSMRIALLCEHKYMAVVNNFGDTEKTIAKLEADGAISLGAIYRAARENLKERGISSEHLHNNAMEMNDRLSAYIGKQTLNEANLIYPEEMDEVPLTIRNKEKDVESSEELVDMRKPLEQTIAEHSEIDTSRIVDENWGSGALNEFVPATKIKGLEDFVFESEHYQYYKNTLDFPLNVVRDETLNFPENLHIYTYEMGNISTFKPPRRGLTGTMSHYLLDGASVLPPLMLDVRPGDRVLDACAAPGGKSLVIMQTMYPDMLVCNDLQESRVARIERVMRDYLYDFEERWLGKRCILSESNAITIRDYGTYDRVLVDVPCTTDRQALMENDHNIFHVIRIKERLRLPEVQAAILTNCIQLLKPGGTLVYSTCSLSPVQNDGVVHMAMSSVFRDLGITMTIHDLSAVIQPFSQVFKFEHPQALKYGQIVKPHLLANFGPMYFCKMTRDG